MTTTTTDQAIEAEIQAKGKTAPRVTPADVEAAIAHEHYFTGQDGANGAHVRATGGDVSYSMRDPLCGVQFCVLVLKNGHIVTGEALLQDLSKPDPERARASARRRAFDKAYDMVVYAERERLAAPHVVYLQNQPSPEMLQDLRNAFKHSGGGKLIAMPLPQGEAAWTQCSERLPDPGFWLVTVETDSGREVHVLEMNAKLQWIHEGEPTFRHGYQFTPVAWAARPAPDLRPTAVGQ